MIKYRKWIGKDDDPWRIPESEKDDIWEKWIPPYFTFPQDYDKEQVKKKQKKSWGHASRLSRGHYTRNLSSRIKSQIGMVESTPSRSNVPIYEIMQLIQNFWTLFEH